MSASPSRAIFLSYAREDSDAARRIADALRALGIEVWFDQSELRGGDAWDASIRRQIRECALFVPVISARTEDRHEGYFRREWRLAIDRMHDIAEGVPFLVPVVIDDTSEVDAVVPEAFKDVQWTRLPHGLPHAGFVQRVQQLLAKPARPGPAPTTSASLPASAPAGAARRSRLPLVFGALAVVAIAAAVFAWLRLSVPADTNAGGPRSAAATVMDKSIAVLPFRNMSAEAANAYFCDGVQEDILTQLANIGDLRVISRTSVMQYRDTTKSIRAIAQELGCAYVLEGSVQRAEQRVRVTGQLISAKSDEHLWAKSYDRDLTDIFAIQSEIAREISTSLRAVLTPAESNRLAKLPTKVPAAYDLVLKARGLRGQLGNTREMTHETESLLASATQLDPQYADAWAELCYARVTAYFWDFDHSDGQLARAKEAIDRAVRLAPDDPGVITALGSYYYYGFRDYDRARTEFQRVAGMAPNNADMIASLGYIARRQGRWTEAVQNLRRAFELDPRNLTLARDIGEMFRSFRRYDDARRYARAVADLLEDPLEGQYELASVDYLESGSLGSIGSVFAAKAKEVTPGSPDEAKIVRLWARYAYATGDVAECLRMNREYPASTFGESQWEHDFAAGEVLFCLGRADEARPYLERSLSGVQAEITLAPENALLRLVLAQLQACLGRADEALAAAERARELLPESRDALSGPDVSSQRAWVLGIAGRMEDALPEIARLLRTPWGPNVNFMRLSIRWAPFRKDPRFLQLINDPRNNDPLI